MISLCRDSQIQLQTSYIVTVVLCKSHKAFIRPASTGSPETQSWGKFAQEGKSSTLSVFPNSFTPSSTLSTFTLSRFLQYPYFTSSKRFHVIMGVAYDVPIQLWKPRNPELTQLWQFKELIEKKYDVKFADYEALRQWSVTRLEDFWGEVWHYTGVKASKPYTKVRTRNSKFS